MKKKPKNRWLIALSAVGIHISIGSVYAWSNFTNPLIDQFGWSTSQVQLTFSIAILFLGLS
ncbi:MAG: MFS transporter, partial [Planococcus donghaensis]